jgi:hypothetical protein
MHPRLTEAVRLGEDTPPRGIEINTWQAILVVAEIAKEAKDAAQSAATHALAAHEEAGQARAASVRTEGAIEALSKVARLSVPPLPPMRAPEDTQTNLRLIAGAITQAALRGEALPGTTPDEEVEKVLARVENVRLGRRVRKVLEKAAYAFLGAGIVYIFNWLTTIHH